MFPTRRITTMGGDKFRDEFSLSFDGTNDYIDCGDKSAFDIQSFTISAWIKINDVDYNGILSHYATNNGYNFFVNTDGKLRTYIGDNTGANSLVSGTALGANKWYHCVTTYTSGTRKIYLNGVEDGSSSTAVTITFPTGSLVIGEAIDAYMNGNISEVTIYDKALSASEVKTLYNGREPYNHKEGVCSSNLQAWWRMGDGVLDSHLSKLEIIGDETNPTLGSNLVDSDASVFASGTYGWEAIGNNTIANVSNALEITYVDDDDGADFNLKAAETGFSTNLTIGQTYKVSFDTKINTGSARWIVYDGGNYHHAYDTTNTTFERCEINFVATHATTCKLKAYNMSSSEVLYLTNLVVQEVNGNPGILKNMDASAFKGETP